MGAVCAYCVQWRCAGCKSHNWPDCCDWDTEAEPYWPDGTVAVITQQEPCEPCSAMLAQWAEDQAGDPT